MTEQMPECVVSSPSSTDDLVVGSTSSDVWESVPTEVPVWSKRWQGKAPVNLIIQKETSGSTGDSCCRPCGENWCVDCDENC